MASLTQLTLLIIMFITLFFSLLRRKTKNRTKLGLPPGPIKLPVIGNLHQLGKLPHQTLQSLSKKFGDLMYLQLGSVPAIVISSPDMAEEIFKKHDLVFSGRAAIYASCKLSYNFSAVSTAPYGEFWREMRKIMILELLTVKRVQSFERVRAQEVASMIDCIASSAPDSIDLSGLAFSTINNVITRVAFGHSIRQLDQDGEKFLKIFCDIQKIASEFNVADYFPRLRWINRFNGVDMRLEKLFREIDGFFNSLIVKHVDPGRPEQDHEDIIDVLLKVHKDPNRETKFTIEQIKGVLIDVFIGGTDTSSTTIEWTMSELMRNPKAREKVQQEIRQLCKGKTRVEEDDLPKLTYLKQVIKESLRLHPPAPLLVPRETIAKCIIGDKYEIPERAKVIFNVSAISTDPKYWESPDQFIPERFANSNVDYRGQHFELLPFGFGRRGCPGISFAIPLVELVLANLLLCFDWELPKGMSVNDIDMMEAGGITTHRKIPLHLVASPLY